MSAFRRGGAALPGLFVEAVHEAARDINAWIALRRMYWRGYLDWIFWTTLSAVQLVKALNGRK